MAAGVCIMKKPVITVSFGDSDSSMSGMEEALESEAQPADVSLYRSLDLDLKLLWQP